MRRIGELALIALALLAAAALLLHTPDTDPAKMRAKYGGPPSQFVSLANGQTVHVRDEGPRDAEPIMLLHGSNADLHTWDPWAGRLGNRYRIIRFDQIGHGLTGPAKDGDYSQGAFVKTVDQVADKLGLSHFIIGGNSMGGGIAMAYAIAHPQRVDGLILVDAAGAPIAEQGRGNIGFTLARLPLINRLMLIFTPRDLIAKSLNQSVLNKSVAGPDAVDRYWELLRYPGNRRATMIRFGQKRSQFTAAQVGQVTVPALILWGKGDPLIPFAAATWYDQHLAHSTLVGLPGIGHLPMEEAPDQTAAAVGNWLGESALSTKTR